MRWLGMRWQIALALVAVVVAACAALTLTTTRAAADQFTAQLEQSVQRSAASNAATVAAAVDAHPGVRTVEGLELQGLGDEEFIPTEVVVVPVAPPSRVVEPERAHQFWVVVGRGLLETSPECLTPASDSLANAFVQPGKTDYWSESCGERVMGYALVGTGNDNAWLVVTAVDRGDASDPVPDLRATLLLYSALIVGASVLVAIGLAALLARPLTRTRKMAEAVAAGDLGVRIPVKGRDEVARLATAVNTMADRLTAQIADLEHANETQRRFVSDVAHELRTPTAALLASAETLENPATRDEAATLVAPQLRRLAGLTEDLLEISRMDAGRAELVPDGIDLVDLVAEVVADCGRPDAVTVLAPPELPVTVDAARLRVVLRNLVANALQHGAPPVTITVAQAARLVVSVHDEGDGVPAGLADRVFDRFVRGDEARHGSSSGLGLAIARENARLLGGRLDLGPDRRTFVLTLPARAA